MSSPAMTISPCSSMRSAKAQLISRAMCWGLSMAARSPANTASRVSGEGPLTGAGGWDGGTMLAMTAAALVSFGRVIACSAIRRTAPSVSL